MRKEEKLARQAIAKIQGWMEKEKAMGGGNFTPRVAVKFCGGCNPVVERVSIAQTIREQLSGNVRWVSAEEDADLLLLIEGCLTACADRPELRERAAACLAIRGHEVSEVEKKPFTAERAEE